MVPIPRAWAAIVMLLLAGMACTLAPAFLPGGRDAVLSESEREALFTEPADPIDLELELDESAAVEARIGPEGGRLEAAGPDGARVTLEVPAGAVAGVEVPIRLIPIISIGNSPFEDGLLAGAHFEPEGLILLEPATLRIELAAAPSEQVFGFVYRGQGEDFSLFPAVTEASTVEVPVLHFSGAGAAAGGAEAAKSTQQGMASELGMRAKSAISVVYFAALRDGGPDEAAADIGGILDDWWRLEVRPQLEQAATDERSLERAVREWHQFLGTFTALEIGGIYLERSDYQEEGWPLVSDGVWNTIEAGYRRCASEHDLGEVQHMIEWGTYLDLAQPEYGDMPRIFDLVVDCSTFRLSFESQISQQGALAGVTENDVVMLLEGEIEPLRPGNMVLITSDLEPASGTLEYVAADGTSSLIGADGSRCTATNVGGVDARMQAHLQLYPWPDPASESWRPKAFTSEAEPEALEEPDDASGCSGGLCLQLLFDPGEPKEQVEGDCFGESAFVETDLWDSVFWTRHISSMLEQPFFSSPDAGADPPQDTAYVFYLEPNRERLYGRLTFDECEEYTFEEGFGRTCETTLIDLWHEPPVR